MRVGGEWVENPRRHPIDEIVSFIRRMIRQSCSSDVTSATGDVGLPSDIIRTRSCRRALQQHSGDQTPHLRGLYLRWFVLASHASSTTYQHWRFCWRVPQGGYSTYRRCSSRDPQYSWVPSSNRLAMRALADEAESGRFGGDCLFGSSCESVSRRWATAIPFSSHVAPALEIFHFYKYHRQRGFVA